MDTNPYQTPSSDPSIQTSAEQTYQPKVFTHKGRIGRLRYLAYTMAGYVFFFPAFMAIALSNPEQATSGDIGILTMIIIGLSYCAALIFMACLAVRRLNDVNRIGWWALLLIVPALNVIVGLYLVFARGSKGNNRFGPAPNLNPLSVKIIGLILPFVFFLGIIAAIALPAYVDYTERAQNAAVQF